MLGARDFEEWTDSDKVFSGIFSGCVAAPENCALARDNKTAAELEQAVWDLIYYVKYNPIPIGTLKLDYNTLKGIIVESLYSASSWPQLATLLDTLLSGNLTDALGILEGYSTTTEDETQLFMAVNGIHCSDRDARASSFDEFLPTIGRLYNTSNIMGDVTVGISMTCAQWKIEPKERYEGDFRAQTKNPVLFIGNTYDALTPIKSAYNVSSGFEGSVVLEVNGYGVCKPVPLSCPSFFGWC